MTDRAAGLLLDFGGVLTLDFWAAQAQFCQAEGLPADALVSLVTGDGPTRRVLADLERGAVDQATFAGCVAEQLGLAPEGLLERMAAHLRSDEAMVAAAAAIRRAGVPVGILSNSWGSTPFDPYEAWRLSDTFDVVVISDQVGLRKPDPAIYELAVGMLGVPADCCVFVDDVAAYLKPARELGMTVVHHLDSGATIAALEELFGLALQPAG
jgi:putative hydrolase of the HAD superfamily